MKILGNFIKWFLYITVGILIVCGISCWIEGKETVTVDIFWMILFSAFVTALVTALIFPKEEYGKVKYGIKFVLHYSVLCIIMCYLGERFEWIDFNPAGVIQMIIWVGIVYLLVFMADYIIGIKQANDINKMLQEKYGEEEL